jgi:peptidoglycan hydrolase FlgJ
MTPSTSPAISSVQNSAPPRDAKLWETAQDFEAVLLSQLTSLMFDSAPSDSAFSAGPAEETWRGMMAEEMGKQMARTGGIGLATHVYDQMIRLQEK